MEIWIGRDGERHGPYKEEDVRQWLRSGKMSGADLGWYEGLADWQPLSVLLPDALTGVTTAEAPRAAGIEPLPQTTTAALEDYAGFWKRVAAYIIDAIIIYIPSSLIDRMFGGVAAKATLEQAVTNAAGDPHLMMAAQQVYYAAMWPALVASVVLAWLYFALMESSAWQATLGKMAIGIRVTDLHGQRIGLPRALGRYGVKIISFLIVCIGVLMVAWTARKQGLHDKVAGTLVLNGRASQFRNVDGATGGSFSA
ncbi:MAG: RDD family protein [Rhodanobacter sp.]